MASAEDDAAGGGVESLREKQLSELSSKCNAVGVDLAVLVKSMRATLVEACQVTQANVELYRGFSDDVAAVAAVDAKEADRLVERTLALSLELQKIDKVKRRVNQLDEALQKYEAFAEKLLSD